MQLLKDIISEERMYDQRNAAIVLCDPELEEALDVKALHLTEIRLVVAKTVTEVKRLEERNALTFTFQFREAVSKHLSPLATATINNAAGTVMAGGGSLPAAAAAAVVRSNQRLGLLGGNSPVVTSAGRACNQSPFQPADTTSAGRSLVQQSGSNCLTRVVVARPTPAAPPPAPPPANPPAASSSAALGVVTPTSRFTVKPEFRKVLAMVPGIPDNKMVFTYDEVRVTRGGKKVSGYN